MSRSIVKKKGFLRTIDQEKRVQSELVVKLEHLQKYCATQIQNTPVNLSVVAPFFQELKPFDVSFPHSFDLPAVIPVFHLAKRKTARRNEVVSAEIDKMLKAGIFTLVSSAWSLSVVKTTKKDGKTRSCVDYRIFNRKLKPNGLPLSKIQEMFDELAGCAVFTTLDLFSG